MDLTVGLIGCGKFAPLHLDALVRNEHVRRVIAADPDAEALAEIERRYGIIARTESDWRAVVEDDAVDVVDVLTPHDCHREVAVAALQAGKHVISEKPIARTLDEADEMIAAAREADRRLLVALTQCYFPAVAGAKRLIEAGEIGRPFLAVFTIYDDEVARMSDPEHWKGDLERAGGGVLIDAGYHPLYLLLHLFGRPREVNAMCRSLVVDAPGTGEDTAAVALNFGDGMMANVVVTFADHAERYRADRRIVGTEGVLLIRDDPEDEIPLALLHEDAFSPVPVHNPLYVQPYAVEATLSDLIGAIVEEREPVATTELARDTLAVVLAAYESERTGCRVEMQWDAGPDQSSG
ncbi:MAG: Gfo/Idh/MocA family oxidoreductase [candidate division WS1 bacterium]|nr:Gfo/Idh/MocA family oxidoreductase [candidate division WS1 bacterium]